MKFVGLSNGVHVCNEGGEIVQENVTIEVTRALVMAMKQSRSDCVIFKEQGKTHKLTLTITEE